MFKLLLVDDDAIVRLGIKSMLNWEQNGYYIAGEAEDGEKALITYQDIKPDIILCDVKMPRFNGIELIRRIRETDNEVKIIMLSYYSDFDLVRQSLIAGANDYCLKTSINNNELISVLNKHMNNYEVQYHDRTLISNTGRQSIIKELLSTDRTGNIDLSQYNLNRLSTNEKKLFVICGIIDNYNAVTKNHSPEDKNLIITSVLAVLGQSFKLCIGNEIIYIGDNLYVILINMPENNAEFATINNLKNLVDIARINIHKFTNFSMSFSISREINSYAQISKAYAEASTALEHVFYLKTGNIIIAKDNPTFKTMDLDFISKFEEQARGFIASNSFDELTEYLKKTFESFADNLICPENIRFFSDYIAYILNSECLKRYPVYDISSFYVDEISQAYNLDSVITALIRRIDLLKEAAIRCKRYNLIINKAIKYIETNFTDPNISLKTLSEYLHVSPVYLSSLFKKELSVNFSDYIISQRIKKACELLSTTSMKICEIAEAVGFNNISYFIKTFKREKGCVPKDFRYNTIIADKK